MRWQGFAVGFLGLVGLEVVVSSSTATSRFGNIATGVGNLARKIISPTVPAFGPGSAGTTSSSSSSSASTASSSTAAAPKPTGGTATQNRLGQLADNAAAVPNPYQPNVTAPTGMIPWAGGALV